MSSIPMDDPKAFEAWLLERWREKDDILEQFMQSGRFPPNGRGTTFTKDETDQPPYFETKVQLASIGEYLWNFVPMIGLAFTIYVGSVWWRSI